MRAVELEEDCGDAGEGADRRHQQDQEAAVVLQDGVAADMRQPATEDQRIDQHEIGGDEDVPADQEPRHQPQRVRQQEERHDADRDRNEGARPRVDDADRLRHPPEAGKKRILGFPAGHLRLQFLRSATKRAAARSTSPLGPKIESAESAFASRSRTLCLAPSTPSWVTKVVLPRAASAPAGLPSAAASPSTSSRSSAIWKASPSARP